MFLWRLGPIIEVSNQLKNKLLFHAQSYLGLPLHLGEYQSVNPEANAMKSRSKKSIYNIRFQSND